MLFQIRPFTLEWPVIMESIIFLLALYGFLPAIILLLGMSGIKAQNKNGMVKQWLI